MQTTKSTTLAKRIKKLAANKEITKNSLVYGWLTEIVNGVTEFRPVFTQGSTWNRSSLVDKSYELTVALKKLGLEFKSSNDAPRGGKTGFRIDITTKVKQA